MPARFTLNDQAVLVLGLFLELAVVALLAMAPDRGRRFAAPPVAAWAPPPVSAPSQADPSSADPSSADPTWADQTWTDPTIPEQSWADASWPNASDRPSVDRPSAARPRTAGTGGTGARGTGSKGTETRGTGTAGSANQAGRPSVRPQGRFRSGLPGAPAGASAKPGHRPARGQAAGRSLTARQKELLDAYKSEIRRLLTRSRRYPPEARVNRLTGVVRISFVVDRRGRVQNIAIVGSSGHRLLDDEAVALIRRAGPFPALPKELTMKSLELTLPITFTMQ